MNTTSKFGSEKDIYFMQLALKQAQKAYANDEVPIGAVIVSPEGEILAQACNKVEKAHTQLAHAECLAITIAGKKMSDWRLEGCWLYVTLEPCALCMYLCLMSRLEGIVYGARSPLFGFRLDNTISIQLYQKRIPVLIEGVGKDEAEELLKKFFKTKRKKGI